jgi:hypothetical protein
MAEPLPAVLKIPEVSRFINRANQLRTIKPALAYWCEYHAVNQIVGKGLHNSDESAFEFTKTLIERLETTKTERADDEAIIDNAAGQAYVEQFAQQTFDRAERALRADKVTRYVIAVIPSLHVKLTYPDKPPIHSMPLLLSSILPANGASLTPRLSRRSSSQSGMPLES